MFEVRQIVQLISTVVVSSIVQCKRTIYNEIKTEKILIKRKDTGFLGSVSMGITTGFSVGIGWVRGLKSSFNGSRG